MSKTMIEPHTLWAGVPAKFIKKLPEEEIARINAKTTQGYLMYKEWFKEDETEKQR